MLIISMCVVFFAFAIVAHADNPGQGAYDTGFVPLADYTKSTQLNQALQNNGNLSQYLNDIFTVAISFGAIAAVVRITWGGFLYMGTDMWDKKGRAKQIISDAVIGLLILLGIYLILYQINPDLLNFNILNDFKTTSTST